MSGKRLSIQRGDTLCDDWSEDSDDRTPHQQHVQRPPVVTIGSINVPRSYLHINGNDDDPYNEKE